MKLSKYRRKNNSKRTRKMKGGRDIGNIGVKVESASESQYINPSSISLCPGCRSDNTTAQGAYSLNTPLPDWPPSWNKGLMVGGGKGKGKGKKRGKRGGGSGGSSENFTCGGCGQQCKQAPLQFLQSGGGSGRRKRSRKLKGGGFWDFAKPFWNPSNPGAVGYENGYKVLAPSFKGISPSGLGSPVSTAGYEPPTKPWSAEFRNDKHLYQRGGGSRGAYSKGHKNKSRKLKGGSIISDIVNFGRTAVYGAGTAFNNFRGISNEVYASPPTPLYGQFPKGYGTGKIIDGGKQFMDIKAYDIKNIYKNATHISEKI